MLSASVLGVGVIAPGMEGWNAARAVLRGDANYLPKPLERYKPQLLPANERRRATWLVQLALRAVEDCLGEGSSVELAQLASVFASSGGDTHNLHGLCEQLARDPKGISPTAFHNSVHNAVAGYFGIGAGARAPSTSLSAHDDTFSEGLLEALAWVADRAAPVLFVAYDTAVPAPLFAKRQVQADVAIAFLLAPLAHPGACATLELHEAADSELPTALEQPDLETLRRGNPAARALPLLLALANAADTVFVLGEHPVRWRAQVRCA